MLDENAPTWSKAAPDRDDGMVSAEAPVRQQPSEECEHYELYSAVEAALYAVPAYFKSELNVVDVEATDLFQFNTPLAA